MFISIYLSIYLSSPCGVMVWFDAITAIVGYSITNPFLYIETVLFQIIQFSKSVGFVYT